MLMRVVAVVTSSIATIISTVLPLAFGYDVSKFNLFLLFILLVIGGFLVHGVLTHVFNDITDFHSGTDQESPGLLSGGSRVLQTGTMTLGMLKRIGLIVTAILVFAAALFFLFGQIELAILCMVGLWGAATYSLAPFRFAYRPFLGEWLSLFPSLLLLGLAAPWIMLDHIPAWAWQNALINAIWCIAWVMIHHVPDIPADRRATPCEGNECRMGGEAVWNEPCRTACTDLSHPGGSDRLFHDRGPADRRHRYAAHAWIWHLSCAQDAGAGCRTSDRLRKSAPSAGNGHSDMAGPVSGYVKNHPAGWFYFFSFSLRPTEI